MIRKISALLAAFALAVTTLAPVSEADARDRRGGYHHRDYDRHHWRRDRHDDGDALAAGAVGLILGLAIGSLASQPRDRGYDCYDNYRRCAPPPPPPCRNPCGYERDSYYDPRYDDRYRGYDDGSAYAGDYGYDPYEAPRERCTRRERQWDRYANRYVTVDVPC